MSKTAFEKIKGGLDEALIITPYVAEIEALRAKNEKLRAALKPFSEQYDAVTKEFGKLLLPDDANSMVKYVDLRAAKAALEGE